MSTIYILHGCPSDKEKAMSPETRTYDKHWMPWLREKLEADGRQVETPLMPTPWTPDYQAFKKEFEKYSVSESDILVGHSCGAAFLVRWLGETKQKVARLVLVAPWKVAPEGDEIRAQYYGYEIDRTIQERAGEIIIYTSDDEAPEGKESARVFHEALGGQLIVLAKHGHYTERDMGTVEFPELYERVTGSSMV